MAKHRAELWSDPHPWAQELLTDDEVSRYTRVGPKEGYARVDGQLGVNGPGNADAWSQLL